MDMEAVSAHILATSTTEWWRRHFLKKAGGDPVKAKELEQQLDEAIKNAPGLRDMRGGHGAPPRTIVVLPELS
jgi:hypothetical protein